MKGRILAPCLRRGDGIQSLNYCVDDPVSCIDPQGLESTAAEASAGGASHKGISHAFGAPHGQSAGGKLQAPSETTPGKSFTSTPYSYNIREALQRATKGQMVEKMPVEEKIPRFYLLADMLKEAADHLNIDPDFFMALSSYESGWLDEHNFELNNLFGVTNAGKRNLPFTSLGESVEYWVKNFGERVRGSKSMEEFIHGLRYNGPNAYNKKSVNPRLCLGTPKV